MLRTYLPDQIELPDGTVLNKKISYVPGIGDTKRAIIEKIKSKGGKYRLVKVFGRRLRGKFDLHGRPYRPTTWILTDVDIHESAPSV